MLRQERQQPSSGGALPALTSIRFFAAFSVLLCHYTGLGLIKVPAGFLNVVDGGRSAVSLFFVLSGFILTYTYRERVSHGHAKAFYQARFARIYPVLTLGLVLCVPVVLYLTINADTARLLHWYSLQRFIYPSLAVSLLCQVLVLNAWFPFAAVNQPWNGVSDSVSCEAFFYLLFPFLLRKLTRMRHGQLALACAGAWAAQGLWIAFLARYLPASRSGFLIFALPVTRLSEFVLGIGAAIVFQHLKAIDRATRARGIALVGVSLILLAAVSVSRPVEPAFYLQSPLVAALILGLALINKPVIGVLNQRLLVLLGEASYALYLVHVPLAHLALIAGYDRSKGWIPVVAALLLSVVIFKFYEEPMRKHIKARFAKRAAPPEGGYAECAPIIDANPPSRPA